MASATNSALILRSRAKRGVSKDGVGLGASWFETRNFVALLTMRPNRPENQKPGAGAGLLFLLLLGVVLLDAPLANRTVSKIVSAFATRPKW